MSFSVQTAVQNSISLLTLQVNTKSGPVSVHLPRQPVPLDLVNGPNYGTRNEDSIVVSTYHSGPPVRPPSQLPPPGNLQLSGTIGKRVGKGEASAIYALDDVQIPGFSIPPVVVKIARPNHSASLAREAWFYDEMECLQGNAIPRCYGWFEVELTRDNPIHAWKTRCVSRWDDSLDVGGLENDRSNGAPHAMLEDRCWRPNHLSILLLERLGERIPPLRQPMAREMREDIESLFEDVAHLGIEVTDNLRYENILSTLAAPAELPGTPSPFTNRTHTFRLVNFDKAFKSGFTVWRIKSNLSQPLASMFEDFEEDRRAFYDFGDIADEGSHNWDAVYYMADTEEEDDDDVAKLVPRSRSFKRRPSQRQTSQLQLSQGLQPTQPCNSQFFGSQPSGQQLFGSQPSASQIFGTQSSFGAQPGIGSQPFLVDPQS